MFKKFAIIVMTLVIGGCIGYFIGNANVAANEVKNETTVSAEQNEQHITRLVVYEEIYDSEYSIELYAQNGRYHVKLESRIDDSDPGIAASYNFTPSAEDIEELWDSHIQN